MKQIKVRKRTAEAERSGRRLRKTGPPPEMTRDPVTSEEKQTGRVEVSDSFKDTDPRMQLGRRGGGGFGGGGKCQQLRQRFGNKSMHSYILGSRNPHLNSSGE